MRKYQFTLRQLLVAILLLAPPCAYIGWKVRQPSQEFARGRRDAESDWARKTAVLFTSHESKYEYTRQGISFSHRYDSTTGLPVRYIGVPEAPQSFSPYVAGYASKIEELLESKGTPDWSTKQLQITDQELADALNSESATLVEAFPCELSHNIILLRGGSLIRWEQKFTALDDSVSIATPLAHYLGSRGLQSVTYERLDRCPSIIFVREGNNWINAFHEDGRLIATAESR